MIPEDLESIGKDLGEVRSGVIMTPRLAGELAKICAVSGYKVRPVAPQPLGYPYIVTKTTSDGKTYASPSFGVATTLLAIGGDNYVGSPEYENELLRLAREAILRCERDRLFLETKKDPGPLSWADHFKAEATA